MEISTVALVNSEIAGGKKEHRLVRVQILGIEDSAIFRAGYVESVLGTQLRNGGLRDAEVAVLALYHRVLETGGLSEDQKRFLIGSE